MGDDYRQTVSRLVREGYSLKKLHKTVKQMREELKDEREEARAAHEMRTHHAYRPGVDGP